MIKVLILVTLLFVTTIAFAQVNYFYMGDLNAKATKEETKDLGKHMNALKWAPAHKDPTTGKQVFKVLSVEKGSLYDRLGIKAGDFFVNGKSSETK